MMMLHLHTFSCMFSVILSAQSTFLKIFSVISVAESQVQVSIAMALLFYLTRLHNTDLFVLCNLCNQLNN